MPRVRSSYGRQGTRAGRRRPRRRRASVRTRIRYQRPSARNQRQQLSAIAKVALRNERILRTSKVYTDWFLQASTQNVTGLWFVTPLMSIKDWLPSLRQDVNAKKSQAAYLRNMSLEWFASSDYKNQATQFQVFVVSLRRDSSNWQPRVGPDGQLLNGEDYREMGGSNAPVLNSSVFKVHYSKEFRLFPRNNPTAADPTVLDYSGDPFSTYRRGRINLRLGMKVRSAVNQAWKDLVMDALPPNQRLYLCYRGVSNDSKNQFSFNWGTHVTAIHQD